MSEFSVNTPIGVSFIVKNISPAPGKIIYVLENKIYPGRQLDLMKLRGIGQSEIRDALLKGDLGKKIKNGFLQVVFSSLLFPEVDGTYVEFLSTHGLTTSIVNNTTSEGGDGGGSSATTEPGTVSIPEDILIESTTGSVSIRGIIGEAALNLTALGYVAMISDEQDVYVRAESGTVEIYGDDNVQVNAEGGQVEILGSGGEGPGVTIQGGNGVTIESGNGDIDIIADDNMDITANDSINIESTDGDVRLTASSNIELESSNSIDANAVGGITLDTPGSIALNVNTMGPVTFINMNTSTMNLQSASVNMNSNNNDIFTVNGSSFFTGPVRLVSIFTELENASIGLSDLINPFPSGFYEVSVYLTATTPGSGGTVFATIGYTDGSGATTQVTPTLTFGSPTRVTGRFLVESTGIDALTYSTTAAGLAGGALYSLRISVTRIG